MSGRTPRARRAGAAGARPPNVQAPRRRYTWVLWAAVVAVAAGGAFWIAKQQAQGPSGGPDAAGVASQGSGFAGGSDDGGRYRYDVGAPGPGEMAPSIDLPASTGGRYDLAAFRGKEPVLLFFQEGLTCQPCWDQLVAIQRDAAKFSALGIGSIVSISVDPLDLIKQKVTDEGITIPALADPDAAVTTAYDAGTYQMPGMGKRAGHSFILVGKDGRIVWRADYGGPPNYSMFVPTEVLLRELRQAMSGPAAAAPPAAPRAPDFTLEDIDGRTFSLAAQRGKVVVIDFLQAGCPTCAEQVPLLDEAARRFGPGGVEVVIVDLSGLGDDSLRGYYRGQYGASEKVVVAADRDFRAASAFRLTAMIGFVVGRAGEIRWQGPVEREALFKAIEEAA